MEKNTVIVIDRDPQAAEEANSLLRNAGLAIQTRFLGSAGDVDASLDTTAIAVLVGDVDLDHFNLAPVFERARARDIPVAVRVSPARPEHILDVLGHGASLAIHADEAEQQVEFVRAALDRSEGERRQGGVVAQMEELEERYNLLLDTSSEAIAYIHEGLHVYANPAYLKALEIDDFSTLEGLSLLELMTAEGEDLKALLRDIGRGQYPEGPCRVSIDRPGGARLEADLTFSPARFHGESCTQMMVRERNRESEMAAELDRLRRTDHVTHMVNRRTFTEQLDEWIARGAAAETAAAVLYLEPDAMAELSEELGVAGTDRFMSDLADVVRECIEADDVPARFGDHSIAVLIRRDRKGGLEKPAQCIVETYHDHIVDLGARSLSASCSVGLAHLGPHTRNADEILAQAREAFREAATHGNRLARYRPKLQSVNTSEADDQWTERVRYALNNNDFYSVQRSIVELDGEGEGLFENVTFMREDHGDTRSDQFISAAEQADLASSIDRHVIPGLLEAISGTGDRHMIPVSGNSIADFSFPGWFTRQLDDADVEGRQVVLTLDADAALSNLKPAQRLIEELRRHGCHFALSGFDGDRRKRQLLEHLRVQYVKLEPRLLKGLARMPDQQEEIKNAVHAADSARAAVIADEVNEASDLAILWQCGVKLVAGEFLKESPQVVGQ